MLHQQEIPYRYGYRATKADAHRPVNNPALAHK